MCIQTTGEVLPSLPFVVLSYIGRIIRSSRDEHSGDQKMMELTAGASAQVVAPNDAPVQAVDISNYQNDMDALMAMLVDWQIEHVVVRLSTESAYNRQIAIDQLRILYHAGFSVSGYIWCYFWAGPRLHTQDALNAADRAGVPLSMVWFDCEDDDGADPVTVPTWLNSAVQAVQASGRRAGIYTGRYWWRTKAGDTEDLSNLPLWLASYDANPSLQSPLMPFAGWTELAGKQYWDKPLDRDVFSSSVVVV
jgi:GH25 family lysozyme M1 (1,4-beta-N-acetylmuramidase)